MRRKCGACDSFVTPYEVQRIAGIPFVHRYRCACTTKFDIATPFGRFLLIALNVVVVGAVLFVPASKFATSNDRIWILVLLLGVQVPVVVFYVARSVKNDRFHARTPE